MSPNIPWGQNHTWWRTPALACKLKLGEWISLSRDEGPDGRPFKWGESGHGAGCEALNLQTTSRPHLGQDQKRLSGFGSGKLLVPGVDPGDGEVQQRGQTAVG